MLKIQAEMEVRELALPGLLELRPRVFEDDRGYFFESYNLELFKTLGIKSEFLQDNQSFSKKGVVRGLHMQAPDRAQAKLVRVAKGVVLDVAVDVRIGSKTYGHFLAIELSEEAQNMLFIPEGFAHGFSALTDCIFQYKCTDTYHKLSETGINPFDKTLKIDWKIEHPIVSQKDLEFPDFEYFKSPFTA